MIKEFFIFAKVLYCLYLCRQTTAHTSKYCFFFVNIMDISLQEASRRSYVAPSITRWGLSSAQHLLNSFSFRGSVSDWELSVDEVEVTQDNNLEWWQ